MNAKSLTFVLMDPPYESERLAVALQIIGDAAARGMTVNVFAYEGAVAVPFSKQKRHANAVHGRDEDQEDHPLTSAWVSALIAQAKASGGSLDWVNCGLCVDERGVFEAVEGVRRGSPVDFLNMARASDNTLVIATR